MKYVNIGGQAILEGVMMKGPDRYAIAVRKPDNEIKVDVTPYRSATERHGFTRIPVIRGVVAFVESLLIGMKTMMDSAAYFEDEDEEGGVNEDSGKDDKGMIIFSVILSIILAVGLFIALPTVLSGIMYRFTDNAFLVNAVEGLIRIIIFLGYVYIISIQKDIRRTYMYHGAEHKTIHCLEAGEELTVENCRRHTRFNKRCGTSYLFIVIIISIIVFMFIDVRFLPLRLLLRILLIPFIAGISYEVLRYSGRHDNKLSDVLSFPGLLLQRLTTREPDDDMLEVAISSVDAVIDWREYIECVRNDSFEK